jgi:hypothetical protein
VIRIIASRIWQFFVPDRPGRIKEELEPKATVAAIHVHYHNHIYSGAAVSNTTVNNSGAMGWVNTGKVSHVQNIETNIGKLKESEAAIADAFSSIKSAIKDSKLIPSEEEREELLEALDGLTESAMLSEDERGSLIKSSIRGFAQACQAVGDISAAWSAVEGPIKNFFGFQ